MEHATHRITLKTDSLEPNESQDTTGNWVLSKQFRREFEEAVVAFKQEHPTAQVPVDRQPELVVYGDGMKVIGETSTYLPEDFNKRVLWADAASGCGPWWMIQRGIDLAIGAEVRKGPEPQNRRLVREQVRGQIRRVDVQFAYETP